MQDLQQEEQLIELVFRISKSLKRESCFDSKIMHLSMREIQALTFLKDKERIKMQSISTYMQTSMPTATVMVDKLVEKKLVKRSKDEKDRRSVLIYLTKDGKHLLDKAMINRRNKFNLLLSYLSEEEKKILVNILKNLDLKLNKNNEKK
jgi:DNA-binding MarR family transcriptional regulator